MTRLALAGKCGVLGAIGSSAASRLESRPGMRSELPKSDRIAWRRVPLKSDGFIRCPLIDEQKLVAREQRSQVTRQRLRRQLACGRAGGLQRLAGAGDVLAGASDFFFRRRASQRRAIRALDAPLLVRLRLDQPFGPDAGSLMDQFAVHE